MQTLFIFQKSEWIIPWILNKNPLVPKVLNQSSNMVEKGYGYLGGEAVWVNGTPAGVNTDTLTYTIYPNPYITVNGNRWTKHYYVGSERIVSRTGTLGGFGSMNTGDNYSAGHGIQTVSYDGMIAAEEDSVAAMYERFGVPYGVLHASARGNADILYFPITKENDNAAETAPLNRNHPHIADGGQVYYFQRDHLGSTMSVTDSLGAYVQQVEYTPWGEVFVERNSGSSGYETPYLFNGKELDDETGLYYYGARYYDPKLSLWFSVDPLSYYNPLGHDNHIDGKHNGGIFNQGNLNPYIYCYNNSVKYLDPNGEQVVAVHGTWSDNNTWEDKQGISRYAAIKFGNTSFNFDFKWSGGNFSSYRYDAADQLIKHIRLIRIGLEQTEPITLVGHSHGGNVCIEAINKMVLMHEFDDIKINLLTINTPVRKDHQLSYEAQKRVHHINVFDPFDPVQIMGGNLFELTPILKKESPEKPYGEFGPAKRKFKNAYNIEVNNPQNAFHDYHNSHNRVKDWEDK